MVQLLSQVVYETNADVTASYEAMAKNPLVVADQTEKGLLWFKFKDNRTVFLLSPLGKLQVKWNDVSEKRTLFRLVRNLLAAKPNEKLVITPLRQQTWIDYPVPDSFRIYWCEKATDFIVKAVPESTRSANAEGTASESKRPSEDRRLKVFKALEELRLELRFFREPTRNEVALKSGCMHESDLRFWLTVAGWKAQDDYEAMWIAERALNLACWLRFKESGELNPKLIALSNKALDLASISIVVKAQVFLKNCPDLAPKIEETRLAWPDETKTKWIQAFGCEPPAEQSWN